MLNFTAQRLVPYTPKQMRDMVADVPRYGEFLSAVKGVRILEQDAQSFVAELIIGAKGFNERFTSRVWLDDEAAVRVEYLAGPMKSLENNWRFTPYEGGCALDFHVSFEMRNPLLNMVAGQVFEPTAKKLVSSFEKRAAALYSLS
jgi:coenzyme Q-binding protein COQ10